MGNDILLPVVCLIYEVSFIFTDIVHLTSFVLNREQTIFPVFVLANTSIGLLTSMLVFGSFKN